MPCDSIDTCSYKELSLLNETSFSNIIRETYKKLDSQPAMNPGISNLLSIKTKYQNNFGKVSNCFEIWAKNRRRTIDKLSGGAKTIKNSRQICYKAILTFSSLTVIASTVSLFLNNVNKSWSAKSFLAAATVGSFSFLFSLFDVYVSKTKADEIELMYQDDKFTLDDLEQEIQFGALNNDIHEFFPNGVNYKIVKNMIEPQLMKRKELSHFKTLFDEMDSASDDEKIFYAIVLSNILSDPDLLQDTYFLAKVQMFSKSTLAEKWWNRLKYENSSHHSEKMKLLSEIKSFSKLEKLFISGLSVAVSPMSNDVFLNAVALAFVNCIILFDVYNELKIQIEPKEASNFKQLENVLRAEYEELKKVYDLLNPYND
ncbi:uncharacterized protein [Parasteatoda tepidariorum]|uniref:uncharacterized protein n=1 Tax=Parasteatoda tepidariorum TaxID=114398 RepID=UPI00077F83E1|nr:uncharacterized protein LOC107448077 [Parasteatoda tepidariorum]